MAKRKPPEQAPTHLVTPEAIREDLSVQIAETRKLMARITALAAEVDDFKALVGLLDKYSQASTRLATLLKLQRSLGGEQDLAQALHQALAEVLDSETP